MYLTDWNKDPLTWMNKLWPGWDVTLKKNGVEDITSIGKFKVLQLSKVVANFSVLTCTIDVIYCHRT